MVKLAAALKAELALAARKAVADERKAESQALAAAAAETAALRRRVEALERALAAVAGARRENADADASAAAQRADGAALRFSAKGLVKLRERLGLSAADLGLLIGVSAQSVYKWEDGRSHPRARPLRAIAGLRDLGKREAAARLAELKKTA